MLAGGMVWFRAVAPKFKIQYEDKGTVSRKLTQPPCCSTSFESSRFKDWTEIIIFFNIKPSRYKICLKFSVFTGNFTFKVPASAQVLACMRAKHFETHLHV